MNTPHLEVVYLVCMLEPTIINLYNKLEMSNFTYSKDMIKNPKLIKLALYGTNGRLFTTDVSAKFKVT